MAPQSTRTARTVAYCPTCTGIGPVKVVYEFKGGMMVADHWTCKHCFTVLHVWRYQPDAPLHKYGRPKRKAEQLTLF